MVLQQLLRCDASCGESARAAVERKPTTLDEVLLSLLRTVARVGAARATVAEAAWNATELMVAGSTSSSLSAALPFAYLSAQIQL